MGTTHNSLLSRIRHGLPYKESNDLLNTLRFESYQYTYFALAEKGINFSTHCARYIFNWKNKTYFTNNLIIRTQNLHCLQKILCHKIIFQFRKGRLCNLEDFINLNINLKLQCSVLGQVKCNVFIHHKHDLYSME